MIGKPYDGPSSSCIQLDPLWWKNIIYKINLQRAIDRAKELWNLYKQLYRFLYLVNLIYRSWSTNCRMPQQHCIKRSDYFFFFWVFCFCFCILQNRTCDDSCRRRRDNFPDWIISSWAKEKRWLTVADSSRWLALVGFTSPKIQIQITWVWYEFSASYGVRYGFGNLVVCATMMIDLDNHQTRFSCPWGQSFSLWDLHHSRPMHLDNSLVKLVGKLAFRGMICWKISLVCFPFHTFRNDNRGLNLLLCSNPCKPLHFPHQETGWSRGHSVIMCRMCRMCAVQRRWSVSLCLRFLTQMTMFNIISFATRGKTKT